MGEAGIKLAKAKKTNYGPVKSLIASRILVVFFAFRMHRWFNEHSVFRLIHDYRNFIINEFDSDVTHNSREDIWKKIYSLLLPEFSVIELGVAYGYIQEYWTKKQLIIGLQAWIGYDTFTGLPEEWRWFKKGAFSSLGNVPVSTDSRISFVKGNVFDTFVIPERLNDGKLFVIFDFDLYEPSLFAFEKLQGTLRKDDVLYFDEAFANEERRLIEKILKHFDVRFIGSTNTGLAVVLE